MKEATDKALLALIGVIRVLDRGVFAEAALHTIADQGKRLICLNHSGSSWPKVGEPCQTLTFSVRSKLLQLGSL